MGVQTTARRIFSVPMGPPERASIGETRTGPYNQRSRRRSQRYRHLLTDLPTFDERSDGL